jgi:hypothetical protein
VRVAGGTADIETGQLLIIKWGGLMHHDVRVAGGTADTETGQLVIIKRCLCPIVFCNYKNVSMLEFFPIVMYFFIILS